MAKAGIGADAVRQMCHAELSAWFEDIPVELGHQNAEGRGSDCVEAAEKPEGNKRSSETVLHRIGSGV